MRSWLESGATGPSQKQPIGGRAAAFEADWPAYDQIALDGTTLGAVSRLVRQYPLRGADAVHIAAALWLREHVGEPLELWASDDRLLEAARHERLTTVDPEG